MAKPIVKKKPFVAREFTVSGQTYEDALKSFRIKPLSKRKKGYGLQYAYRVETAEDFRELTDHMAVKAVDLADEIGDTHPRVQGIYDQMSHIID